MRMRSWRARGRRKLDPMSELDLRKSPWNEGLGISSEYLDHQLYLLGCMVYASRVFDSLADHALLDLRKQFQEREIGQALLGIAVAIRNAMDQNPSRADYWLDGVDANVGTLYPTAHSNTSACGAPRSRAARRSSTSRRRSMTSRRPTRSRMRSWAARSMSCHHR